MKPVKRTSAATAAAAAAFEEALLRKRIEAVQRLQQQLAVPGSVAGQCVAAYSDLLDGENLASQDSPHLHTASRVAVKFHAKTHRTLTVSNNCCVACCHR